MISARSGPVLLIVGNPEVFHVGGHLLAAAQRLGLPVAFCDIREAFAGTRLILHVNWHLRGHRPPRLEAFSDRVVRICREVRPRWLLSTGITPLDRPSLQEIGQLGVERINYLTDDPWNPVHLARWFFEALPCYDQIFSPRLSNLEDIRRVGTAAVSYLPFAYAPAIQFPEPPTPVEQPRFASDVVFIGSADQDRLPFIVALMRAGVNVGLYGAYWSRYAATRSHARGFADPVVQRKAIGGAKVALCLVRRANRDGHTMRTFEIPAMGGCMLTEDTDDHRLIFGADGEAVVYFHTVAEMIERLRWLLDHDDARRRLADAVHRIIVNGANTYEDRLRTMLHGREDGVPAAAAMSDRGGCA